MPAAALHARHARLHASEMAWWVHHVKTHGLRRAQDHYRKGTPPCPPKRPAWMPRTWKPRGYDG